VVESKRLRRRQKTTTADSSPSDDQPTKLVEFIREVKEMELQVKYESAVWAYLPLIRGS